MWCRRRLIAPTPLFTGTCSFCLRRHMAPLSQGTARACLSGPTAAHRHDRHSLQEAAPYIKERGQRSSDLAAVSCPSHLAYIGTVCPCTPRCSDTDALLRCWGHAYTTPAFLLWKQRLWEPLAGIMPVMNAQRKRERIASHTCLEFGNESKSHVSSNWRVLLEKMWSKWLT